MPKPPAPTGQPSAAEHAAIDPIAILLDDRARARSLEDPCASLCTLANIDEHGAPQARTLVLRELEERLAVFINTTSPKWQALLAGPVTLVVWLPSLQVQYRLGCATAVVPQELVHESWHLRPEPPKRLDWFYTHVQAQSSEVTSRDALLDALAALDAPEPLTPPATAHGLFLEPQHLERLHLGQDNGVHDRQLFRREGVAWTVTTLVP